MKSDFKSITKATELGNLPIEWKVVEIDELLERVIDYRGKTPKKAINGIPVLSAKSVKGGRIDYGQVYFISQDTYKEWETRGRPEIGDVLVTTEGPLGEVAQYNRTGVAVAQRLQIILKILRTQFRGFNDRLCNFEMFQRKSSQIADI